MIEPDPFEIDIPVPAVMFANEYPDPFPIRIVQLPAVDLATPVPLRKVES